MVWKSGKRAVGIGFVGNLVSLLPVVCAHFLLTNLLPEDLSVNHTSSKDVLYFWCMSSFVVIASVVDDLKLLNSKVGRLAISISLIYDLFNIVLARILTSIQIGSARGVGSIASFFGLLAFVLLVARPITLRLLKLTPKGELLDEVYFATVVMLSLTCGFLSEVAGHGLEVGMFVLGLALPSGPPLGITLVEKLEGITLTLGIPIFVASVGISIEPFVVGNNSWCYLVFMLLLSFCGKVAGTVASAIFFDFPIYDAVALALILASKGIIELRLISYWQFGHTMKPEYVTTILIYVAFLVAVTTPVIRFLYNPSKHYTSDQSNMRNIEQTKSNYELRIIACVHSEENVTPIVHLLETLNADPCPICVYVLHLVQLVGQAMSSLIPYNRKERNYGSSADSSSDAIMNVFRNLEDRSENCITIQPFVSTSPSETMHDEVGNLALEKMVSFIIIPFHKTVCSESSTLASLPNHAARTMNANVLSYAPCSVGILANSTQGSPLPRDVVVYFFGGSDDREALSLAMRMSQNPRISLTVIRFVPPYDSSAESPRTPTQYDESAMLDEDIIEEFRMNYVMDNRVVYTEEIVADVEETIKAIQSITPNFTLLIVGRRIGADSVLAKCMSMWSEYPELGDIGDLVASTNYGTQLSILVIQQQATIVNATPTMSSVQYRTDRCSSSATQKTHQTN